MPRSPPGAAGFRSRAYAGEGFGDPPTAIHPHGRRDLHATTISCCDAPIVRIEERGVRSVTRAVDATCPGGTLLTPLEPVGPLARGQGDNEPLRLLDEAPRAELSPTSVAEPPLAGELPSVTGSLPIPVERSIRRATALSRETPAAAFGGRVPEGTAARRLAAHAPRRMKRRTQNTRPWRAQACRLAIGARPGSRAGDPPAAERCHPQSRSAPSRNSEPQRKPRKPQRDRSIPGRNSLFLRSRVKVIIQVIQL